MNTKRTLLTSLAMMLLVVLITGATYPTEPSKTEGSAGTALVQCGVTNAQITTYLQNCPHHHTVLWVENIPGTCNSLAAIENCGTATVYVNDGSIIGHLDNNGICPN